LNVLGFLALLMLASKKAEPAAAEPPRPGVSAAGARVVGQVLLVPLRDGTNAIVAKVSGIGSAFDAIVIARGTVYGSSQGVAAVLRCGSEADAKAIAEEIRGKF
jgi:hypothetical protein